ncbi:MAG: hypothetical protein IPL06_23200 [Betaproteobacteria bacterium]|nr:hypothetical protein [Betaproteobacteria bacterium]
MTAAVSRPLDRAEAFFWFLDRCSSMNFAVMAEGEGPLAPAAFADAVARAQRVHPLLAVAIESPGGGPLAFVPRPDAAVTLERQSPGEAWGKRIAAALARPFALDEAPLVRALWHDGVDGRWAAALVFQHCIADGRSGLRLLREVLEDAIGTHGGAAAIAPREPLTSRFPAQYRGPEGALRAQAWRAQLKADGARRPETLPGFVRSGDPIRPGLVSFRLDESVVRGLVAKAREAGASVHGALGAAELMACRERFAGGVDPRLMLTSPVDLRGHLAGPLDDATPAFAVTLLSTAVDVKAEPELWTLARHLTRDLRRQVAEGCGHLFYQLVPPAETLPPTPEAIEGIRAYLARMPTACVLSNAGSVTRVAGRGGVRVDGLSFALCPMGHQPLFVAAATHGEVLEINVVHDEARLPAAEARALAGSLESRLRQAAA